VEPTTSRPKLSATSDGKGPVAHAPCRDPLLADLPAATGLAGRFREALAISGPARRA
jgi:hypothetical protein